MSFQISAFALRHVSAHLLMKSYLLPRQTRHQLRYDCQAFFWKAVPVSQHQSFAAIYPNCRTDVDSSNPVFLKINEKAALKYYLYFTFHKYSFLPHKQQKTMKNSTFFMVFCLAAFSSAIMAPQAGFEPATPTRRRAQPLPDLLKMIHRIIFTAQSAVVNRS